jgi:hypothetical protein
MGSEPAVESGSAGTPYPSSSASDSCAKSGGFEAAVDEGCT